MKFGLVIPTLNAGVEWLDWLEAYNRQSIKPDRSLVIDSGSDDGTAEIARGYGFEVVVIEKSKFDHGGTRQLGAECLAGVDVCVFLTQDAIFFNNNALRNILEPLDDDRVAAVCGRQLPRKNAGPIEAHARLFNYPVAASINSIKDAESKGLKTAFLSNSFAAYRTSALKDIGGFPDNVVFGEDMYVATKLLQAGYEVAYAADASVYHSHNYSVWQEMQRYFDMGVFHANEPWIRDELGSAEGEGIKFIVSEYKYLLKHAFWRIPEGIIRTIFRYIGFRLGLMENWLPRSLKRSLAMNKGYFKK